jgi:hypothetical protein
MANRDLKNNLTPLSALPPASRNGNAATNGTDIDRTQAGLGFEALVFYVHTGARTDGSVAFKLQEADDNGSGAAGTYADVAAGDQIGTFAAFGAAGDQNKVLNEVAYIGTKRWVRLVSTQSGATTGAFWGALALLGHARNKPN